MSDIMKNRFLNRLNRAYSILRGDQDIVISHKPAGSSCSGYVLMSHIPYVPPSLRNTQWHSNIVEYFELIKIFTELGYEVDSIRYDDINFIPSRRYDIFLDVAYNLQRLSPLMSENTVKILYLTTSYIRFANNAELRRVNEFEKRKGCTYSPSVFGPFEDLVDRSLRIADKCILIGNQETKNTFPAEFRNKIKTVTVSASRINRIKKSDEYIPEEKEFLWFFGLGAVHKGLDLVLDAFARNRTWKLNVIGYVDREPGFKKVSETELTSLPNINCPNVQRGDIACGCNPASGRALPHNKQAHWY